MNSAMVPPSEPAAVPGFSRSSFATRCLAVLGRGQEHVPIVFFKWFLLENIGNMIRPQLFRTYLYYFGVPSVWFDNIWQPFCPDSPGWGFGCSAETLWSSAHAFPVQRKQLNGQSPWNTSTRCARPLWNATPFPSTLRWVRCRSGSWQFTWWGFLGNWDTLQQLIRWFCCES